LELHQQHALAFEDTSGISAESVVAQDPNVLQAEEVFIGPWRSEYHIRKQLPGVAIGIINACERWHYCAPPPTRAGTEQQGLFIVAPSFCLTTIN
jgi:hypothetical protein